jgi:hypothetical protein
MPSEHQHVERVSHVTASALVVGCNITKARMTDALSGCFSHHESAQGQNAPWPNSIPRCLMQAPIREQAQRIYPWKGLALSTQVIDSTA